MYTLSLTMLMTLLCSSSVAIAQGQGTLAGHKSDSLEFAHFQLGELEEITMCHHAILAARHDGIALHQNAYYRYVLNAPHKGRRTSNVYPIPERCKTMETSWVLDYTNTKETANGKLLLDKIMHDTAGLTISDIATDAQFMTIVINKIELEGDDAVMWENRDKDVPST